ncbi:MAG: M48 family metallopeptidase [Gammaproteobacteria bacterium]
MIDAFYFDGVSTRRHPVTVVIHQRIVAVRGCGLHRTIRMSKMEIAERLEHAPRVLRFPDGAFIETSDPNLDHMLAANRYVEPRVVRWQRNWPLSLLALILLVGMLGASYQYALPWAVDRAVAHLPTDLETRLGDQGLELMDEGYMSASELPKAEQARIAARFAQLRQPRGERTAYRLEFRSSGVGPNAFALPNGVIVMTDEMVEMAKDDDALMGVLAHELGHLQRRHSLRNVLQTLGMGALVNVWMGDVSSLLTTLPTLMLSQHYSRNFERESDQYAIDMLQHNGIALAPLASLFERMRESQRARSAKRGRAGSADETPDYLSSHPSDAERIARLRAADAARTQRR